MNTTQHLAQLLTLPATEFERYLASVNNVAQLRRSLAPTADDPPPLVVSIPPSAQALPTPVARRPRVESVAHKRLATRRPMRAAKPGTLRGDVHDILRQAAQPQRRATIIAAVAKRRGRAVDDAITSKIGDILTNHHDPYLSKVAYGLYAFSPQQD
jgi:hypothetical protein